jgi:hypothetical protein
VSLPQAQPLNPAALHSPAQMPQSSEVKNEAQESTSNFGISPNRVADLVRAEPESVVHDHKPQTQPANAPKQMPQMPQNGKLPEPNNLAANAPNAPNSENQMPQSQTEAKAPNLAQPTGWGQLWRIERNGENYYRYALRFLDSAEVPKDLKKTRRQGGKITPQIEVKLANRRGRGRHADTRLDAARLRSRAINLAERIRSSATGRTTGDNLQQPQLNQVGTDRSEHVPQLRSVDTGESLPGVQLQSNRDWIM